MEQIFTDILDILSTSMEIDTPSREQGLFYFWFVSLFIEFSEQFYVADKWEYIYSFMIQIVNFILYLIGLFGFYEG